MANENQPGQNFQAPEPKVPRTAPPGVPLHGDGSEAQSGNQIPRSTAAGQHVTWTDKRAVVVSVSPDAGQTLIRMEDGTEQSVPTNEIRAIPTGRWP